MFRLNSKVNKSGHLTLKPGFDLNLRLELNEIINNDQFVRSQIAALQQQTSTDQPNGPSTSNPKANSDTNNGFGITNITGTGNLCQNRKTFKRI
ncbi:unnamed protein product [Didymodactylos carnosus]|uniref:Uncharacterized protein n=1 Tax=Didymodactylos carnosus TaxID=1234261 RepID=A0A8S2F987_9BILA|nr:unnamed protein product [Didymodactylos carnosus]CAF4195335.1 unnamed protein product [Didymodactylos carnosus]